jgi:hypothetical protein
MIPMGPSGAATTRPIKKPLIKMGISKAASDIPIEVLCILSSW